MSIPQLAAFDVTTLFFGFMMVVAILVRERLEPLRRYILFLLSSSKDISGLLQARFTKPLREEAVSGAIFCINVIEKKCTEKRAMEILLLILIEKVKDN